MGSVAVINEDLHASTGIYNSLPDDSAQPSFEFLAPHLHNLAKITVQSRVQSKWGFHLAHSHLHLQKGEIMLGTVLDGHMGYCSKPTPIDNLDPSALRPHTMVVENGCLRPYEYRVGASFQLDESDVQFIQKFVHYVQKEKLEQIMALEVLEGDELSLVEFVFNTCTIMLRPCVLADVVRPTSGRETGWVVRGTDEAARCVSVSTHYKPPDSTVHKTYTSGTANTVELMQILHDEGVVDLVRWREWANGSK